MKRGVTISLGALLVLAPLPLILLSGPVEPRRDGGGSAESEEERGPRNRPTRDEPAAFRGRGGLVCLAEEMEERWGADVPPVHEHLPGFRLAEGDENDEGGGGAPRYLTILRTAQSEALFTDERFSKHPLILTGRTFPGTQLLEVSGWRWIHDGKVFDVYYWCDVCSIRTIDPGPCACCQGNVVLREEEVGPAGETAGDPEGGAPTEPSTN